MILAKHLMVGNLFTDDQNEILKIDLIDSIEETVNANGMENISISDLIPLPLTEDILLKCAGFGKYDVEKNELRIDCFNDLTLYCGETNIVQDKDGNFYSCFIGANYVEETAIYTIGEPFKFLHTFQNRFHSLTQKELTVKL